MIDEPLIFEFGERGDATLEGRVRIGAVQLIEIVSTRLDPKTITADKHLIADVVGIGEQIEYNFFLVGEVGVALDIKELLLDGGDSDRLVEGHPEVCFRAFNGDSLSHSKKTALGVDERLSALETVPEYSDGDWRTVVQQLDVSEFDIGLDDVLDAFALALTACTSDEEYCQLPMDSPGTSFGNSVR